MFPKMEKYMVNKEIGSGTFGKVFLVESKTTGIQYVAKQIDLSKLNKRQKCLAEKEIQVLSKLKHLNIVRYKEAYSDERNLHIVMELCELGDLHGIIVETRVKNESFSDNEVMEYFVQICFALEYVHGQRILHRDLKTKNIFLKRGNIVKLGDFGVAKILENSFELAQTCIGSPFYISPEMCENKPYDKKSDVWALGCVLFELFTLKYAFTARNMKTLITKIITGEHSSIPPNRNVKIRNIITRLLNRNQKQRPTVSEVLCIPYVSEFKEKVSCRNRVVTRPLRCRSGEDLRQNNLRINSGRVELPISKSSVNLNTCFVTDPQTKYQSQGNVKSRIKKPSNFYGLLNKADKHGGVTKQNNSEARVTDVPKGKKLPKTDSQYYSLIEENNRNVRSVSVIKNIFEKSYEVLQNQNDEGWDDRYKMCKKQGNNVNIEQNDDTKEENLGSKPPLAELSGFLKSVPIHFHEEKKPKEVLQRKKWETATADKNQLISLLNETELTTTFTDYNLNDSTVVFTGEMNYIRQEKSVEDLLFMETSDLSHIAVLKPQQVFQNANHKTFEGDRMGLNAGKNSPTKSSAFHGDLFFFNNEGDVQDRTYLVPIKEKELVNESRETAYELLEQRRLQLEQTLGLSKFLCVYKRLEQLFPQGTDKNRLELDDTCKVANVLKEMAQKLGVEKENIDKIWEIVQDDAIYK